MPKYSQALLATLPRRMLTDLPLAACNVVCNVAGSFTKITESPDSPVHLRVSFFLSCILFGKRVRGSRELDDI